MQDETQPLDLSTLSDADWDVLESMRKGDHLVLRDGRLALMDKATFEAAFVEAMRTATYCALRSLSATWDDVADVRPVQSQLPSDSVTTSIALHDGRHATATASLWQPDAVH